MERPSLPAQFVVSADGARPPKYIIDQPRWEWFVGDEHPLSVVGPVGIQSRYGNGRAGECRGKRAEELPPDAEAGPGTQQKHGRAQRPAYGLQSVLEKTAAAVPRVELPVRTVRGLRRVLDEDRLTEAEPAA